LVKTEVYCLRPRYFVWDQDTLSETKIHCLRLTNYYCLCNSIAHIASPLVLQQSTPSPLHVFLTHLPFTPLLLLYCLYCRSLYPYRLHISVLHLFTTTTSTLTFYGFRLPPLHHNLLQQSADRNTIRVTNENSLLFMHDNAPCHTDHPVSNFLEEHGIAVMRWPSQSPDLNPLENVLAWRQTPVSQTIYGPQNTLLCIYSCNCTVPQNDSKVMARGGSRVSSHVARIDAEASCSRDCSKRWSHKILIMPMLEPWHRYQSESLKAIIVELAEILKKLTVQL